MRFFLYYAGHTFVNQLRKLFKTWVLVFLLACMLLGGLIGLGAARLSDAAEQASFDPEATEEAADAPLPETDLPIWQDEERRGPLLATAELIAGGVVLLVLVYNVLSADRNGSRIFLPADVNLLFPSPMTPQSVLMFRLGTQVGTAVLAGIYLLFQLPNLTLNLGMRLWGALGLIAGWCFTIVAAKLLQVLFYLLGSAHPGLKENLRRCVYGALALLALGWFVFWKRSGLTPLAAAKAFFNAPFTRWIPLWGWLKGFCLFAAEGNGPMTLLTLALLLAGGAALVRIIRRIPADFYEDAMARSEETAELLERARSEKSSGIVLARRKKDRSDRIRRDGFHRGNGAWVFFHKALYNRFRFAHLGFLTRTTETYLAAGLAAAAVCRFVFDTRSAVPLALVLAGLAFFRALGNPLGQDTKMDFFRLIPAGSHAKLFASLMGGTANCLLDLLPGLLLGTLVLGGDLAEALAWIPFILSVDLYSTCVGTFLDLSIPAAVGKTIKQVVQIMFVYFGLLPDVAIVAVGLVMGRTALGAGIAAAVNAGLGALFFLLCPLFLEPGSRERVSSVGGKEVDITSARRVFSRIGAAAFLILAVGTALQILLSTALRIADPVWLDRDWVMWVFTFAPLYLAAFPLGWLVLRKIPAHRRSGENLSAGRFLSLIPICVCMMYAGNLVGTGINALLDAVTGASDGNPIAVFALADSLPLKVLFLVILAPVLEELFFRRALVDRIRPYGERLAVTVPAVMFGLFHGNLSQIFYAVLLGMVFGCVYLKTGKIHYTVALHMFVNTLGSVVGPALLERSGAAAGSAAAVLEETGVSAGAAVFSLYSTFLLVLAAVGLALLIVRGRTLAFHEGERELPREKRFSVVWLNPGMILFVLTSLAMVVASLL